MKHVIPFLAIGLLMGIALAACATAEVPDPVVAEAPVQPILPSETPFQAVVAVTPTVEQVQAPAEDPTQVPQPAATSRGPDLHSTNPSTVDLASGELQLVEFFRYT